MENRKGPRRGDCDRSVINLNEEQSGIAIYCRQAATSKNRTATHANKDIDGFPIVVIHPTFFFPRGV